MYTCPGKEVVAVFVKGDCHYTVSEVKRFLDSIAVMNINIDIQDTRIVPAREERQGGKRVVIERDT